MNNKKCNNVSSCSPFIIWRNYALGAVSVSVVPLFIMLLPAGWCHFITLLVSLLLFSFVRFNRKSKVETCMLIPYSAARSLLIITICFVVIDFFNADRLAEVKPLKAMLLPVVVLIVLLVMKYKGLKNVLCIDCLLRNGSVCERKALGHIYERENRYIVPRQIKVAIVGIIVVWGYEIFVSNSFYDSSFDDFIFYFLPLIIVTTDLLMLRFRYFLIRVYRRYDKFETRQEVPVGKKRLRITVVCGDAVYYVMQNEMYETPFIVDSEFEEKISVGFAKSYMAERLGFVNVGSIRFCYGSLDFEQKRSVEHYFCFIDDKSMILRYEEKFAVKGEWMTKEELVINHNKEMFTPFVTAELSRIFRIMTASKIYDIDGHRRIDIKGYIPNFSISEIKNSSLDFSDNRWVYLSKFNRDVSFAKLRLFWYKYIEGLG